MGDIANKRNFHIVDVIKSRLNAQTSLWSGRWVGLMKKVAERLIGRIPVKVGAQRIQMADYATGHPHDLHTSRQSD